MRLILHRFAAQDGLRMGRSSPSTPAALRFKWLRWSGVIGGNVEHRRVTFFLPAAKSQTEEVRLRANEAVLSPACPRNACCCCIVATLAMQRRRQLAGPGEGQCCCCGVRDPSAPPLPSHARLHCVLLLPRPALRLHCRSSRRLASPHCQHPIIFSKMALSQGIFSCLWANYTHQYETHIGFSHQAQGALPLPRPFLPRPSHSLLHLGLQGEKRIGSGAAATGLSLF